MTRLEKFIGFALLAASLAPDSAEADTIGFPTLGFNSGQLVSGSVTVTSAGTLATTTVAGTTQVISGGIIPLGGLDFSKPEDVRRANQFAVINGQFSFTTGPGSHIESERVVVFGPGGGFEITGAIPQLGIAESTSLVSGTFTVGASYEPGVGTSTFPLSGVAVTVHPGLTALFAGLPPNPLFFFAGNIRTGEGSEPPLTGSFTVPAFFANLLVAPAAAPIPEPASLVLLGSGLVIGGVGWLKQRRTGVDRKR